MSFDFVYPFFKLVYLKQNQYEKSQYNQDGNYAYLDTLVNKSIGKKAPNVYFPEARQQCKTGVITIGSITDYDQLLANLETNCVPIDVFDMDHRRYAEFLEKRRVMMAKKIRSYYEAL